MTIQYYCYRILNTMLVSGFRIDGLVLDIGYSCNECEWIGV